MAEIGSENVGEIKIKAIIVIFKSIGIIAGMLKRFKLFITLLKMAVSDIKKDMVT